MKPPYKSIVRFGAVTLLALSTAVTARAVDYQSTILSQDPLGYYRLNETVQPLPNGGATNSGSLGASATGAFVGLPTLSAPGPFAGSVSVGLDGTAQAVSTPFVAGLNETNFTFELWAKPATAPKFAYLAASAQMASPRTGWYLAQDDGTTFFHGSAWVVRTFKQTGTTPAAEVWSPVSAAGDWVHLVLTYDGSVTSLYTNGVLAMSADPTNSVPNLGGAFTVGSRSDGAFFWPGNAAECAMYTNALSATRVAAHYTAATTAPGTYAATVLADAPVLYHRYAAPPSPGTANLGTLGGAGDGLFLVGSEAGATGPVPPVFPGFAATNKAAAFTANGGAVRLPAFNLNTNTVTISAWVNATNGQFPGAGIVVNTGGSGLIMDGVNGGLGLGYYWNNTAGTYNWSPSVDAGLPTLADSEWAFAAVVIQPTEANIYIGLTNGGTITFSSVTNYFTHVSQAFSAATLVGSDLGDPDYSFNGAIDEVAIWSRSLSSGELYTQFASAVDGVAAAILTDLVGPSGPAAVGDPLTLSINAGGTPPLVYTWYKDTVAIAATTNTGTLTIANTTFGDAGTYEVTVTNNFGTAASQQVVVTVVNPTFPVLVGQQGFYASRVLYPTGTLHMAVSATGGGLKYQWYRNGTAIPSATASSYTVASVTAANAGSYTVAITNSVGGITNGPSVITVPTVTPGSYEAAIVSSGPEAWWRLDEAAGATNLFDAVGRHDGNYTNMLGVSTLPTMGATGALIGNTNPAISFNASGGVGVVPHSPQLNGNLYCIELWVRTTNLTQVATPVSNADTTGGMAWLANAGDWNGFDPVDNGAAPLQDYPEYGAAIAPGVWTHLVVAYDVTTAQGQNFPYRYWINGANAGYVWEGGAANFSGPYVIGGTDPVIRPNLFFNGQVDEVAVYRRLLSATEITNHMTARGVELIVPTFTSHPLPQTVTAGKSVTFSAAAVGSPMPLAYQWHKDGNPIPAATNTSYNILSAALSDVGAYSLRATNLAGTNFSTAASLAVVPATPYANVTNDLVLHLKFEGDAQDSSGKGNNGSPSGSPAPVFVTGQVNAQAAEFTTTTINDTNFSSASYVDLGTPTDLLFGSGTSFSVGLWVKLPTNALPGDLPFIGTEVGAANNDGWFLGPSYQAGGWQWNLNDGANNIGASGPDNSINDGNWHYFILTVDRGGAVAKAYLDGVLVSSRSITGLGSVDVGGAVTIGQDPTHTYPEAGVFALDDIGIWRRALTPVEVANIESAGRAGNSFDTVAVLLTITPSGSNLEVNWTPAIGTLLEAANVTGPWTTNGSAPPYTVGPSNAAKFYRVQLP